MKVGLIILKITTTDTQFILGIFRQANCVNTDVIWGHRRIFQQCQLQRHKIQTIQIDIILFLRA